MKAWPRALGPSTPDRQLRIWSNAILFPHDEDMWNAIIMALFHHTAATFDQISFSLCSCMIEVHLEVFFALEIMIDRPAVPSVTSNRSSLKWSRSTAQLSPRISELSDLS
jgi:hypothetical protein